MKIPHYAFYTELEIANHVRDLHVIAYRKNRAYIARPVPYYNFWYRLQMAWDIIRYKADALYWTIDINKDN